MWPWCYLHNYSLIISSPWAVFLCYVTLLLSQWRHGQTLYRVETTTHQQWWTISRGKRLPSYLFFELSIMFPVPQLGWNVMRCKIGLRSLLLWLLAQILFRDTLLSWCQFSFQPNLWGHPWRKNLLHSWMTSNKENRGDCWTITRAQHELRKEMKKISQVFTPS